MYLVGEPYAKDVLAIKVIPDDGKWIRVYRNEHGEIE